MFNVYGVPLVYGVRWLLFHQKLPILYRVNFPKFCHLRGGAQNVQKKSQFGGEGVHTEVPENVGVETKVLENLGVSSGRRLRIPYSPPPLWMFMTASLNPIWHREGLKQPTSFWNLWWAHESVQFILLFLVLYEQSHWEKMWFHKFQLPLRWSQILSRHPPKKLSTNIRVHPIFSS